MVEGAFSFFLSFFLSCFSSLSASSPPPPLYCRLLELSGGLSDANWWVNRSGVTPPTHPTPNRTQARAHTRRHTQIHTAPWNLLQDQMAGNACPPSPAEPWCALWWLRLLFKPSGGSFTLKHTRTHSYEYRHTQSPCVPCTPATRFHTPDSRTAGEHTHTRRNRQTRSL